MTASETTTLRGSVLTIAKDVVAAVEECGDIQRYGTWAAGHALAALVVEGPGAETELPIEIDEDGVTQRGTLIKEGGRLRLKQRAVSGSEAGDAGLVEWAVQMITTARQHSSVFDSTMIEYESRVDALKGLSNRLRPASGSGAEPVAWPGLPRSQQVSCAIAILQDFDMLEEAEKLAARAAPPSTPETKT
jgi:hypothetical protein